MSFGIVTLGPDGTEYFRGQYRTLRVIHHQSISAGFTGVVPITGVTPQNAIAYCVARTNMPYNTDLFATVENGQVRLSRFSPSKSPTTPLDLIVLAIA